MDEYVGLPRDHPESYHSYMWNNFFKHIDIKCVCLAHSRSSRSRLWLLRMPHFLAAMLFTTALPLFLTVFQRSPANVHILNGNAPNLQKECDDVSGCCNRCRHHVTSHSRCD
jgi:hypothetical protein